MKLVVVPLLLLLPASGCITPARTLPQPMKLQAQAKPSSPLSQKFARVNPFTSTADTRDPLLVATELYRQGDLQASRALLRRTRQNDPLWTAGFALEAAIAIDLGERDEAELMLEAAAASNPQSASVQYSTGVLLAHFGNARSGLRALERAVQLDPLNVHYAQELATAYAGFGNLPAAESALETALDHHDNDRTLLLALARTAEAGGRWRKAEICYERALRDGPQNLVARRQRARCLYRLGEYEQAVAEFNACGEQFVREGSWIAQQEFAEARRLARAAQTNAVVAALAVAPDKPVRISHAPQESDDGESTPTVAHSQVTRRLRRSDQSTEVDSPYQRALSDVDPS